MPVTKRRVVLHIGLHKTGTTYIQGVLRANRERLASSGVLYPGGKGQPSHTFAVYDLFGRRPRGTGDDRITGQWESMTRLIAESDLPTAMLSEEATSLASAAQAKKAARSFGDADMQVVVTVRDLGRVALSAWQEDVKTDELWTWREYADALADDAARAKAPARGFWLRQDVPAILDVWTRVVPADHVHVVTVPPVGSEPGELLRRVGSVVGFDAGALVEPESWDNVSVGATGTELLRQMNQRLHRQLNQRQYHDVVESDLAPILAAAGVSTAAGADRLRLPEADHAWVTREADRMIEGIQACGVPVVGDLADLRPRFDDSGRPPGEVTDDELLDAAIDALAGLTERFARAKWRRRGRDSDAIGDAAPTGARVGSATRSAWFRGKRAAVNLADRNPVAEKALGAYLRRRNRH
ncbi:MAG TPA: hypothetical protein VEX15_00350 [Nocardioidaceae bacterium]|nr:hypothetical protein [Nocardioidaceae bacterium]